jgi:hypothetical protein
VVLLFLSAAVLSPAKSEVSRAEQCHTVSGTYAIFANHDLLHIDGSRHFVEVTSHELDAELERRGWEQTVARGKFNVCGLGVASPQGLDVQDQLQLRSWTDIRFGRKKGGDN